MIIKVTEAQHIDAYKIWVRFNNGDCRIFGFATIIDKYPVFEPLKDIALLRDFRVMDTLEWRDGEIDIAPEYLYEHGIVAYPNKEVVHGYVAEDKTLISKILKSWILPTAMRMLNKEKLKRALSQNCLTNYEL